MNCIMITGQMISNLISESTCPTTKFASPTVSFTTRLGDFTKSYTNIRSTLISRATKFESTTPPSKITTNTNIIPSTTSDEKVFTKRTAKGTYNLSFHAVFDVCG